VQIVYIFKLNNVYVHELTKHSCNKTLVESMVCLRIAVVITGHGPMEFVNLKGNVIEKFV